ncbi:hypothetical protein [Hahella sp. NBU794]|uniref:hypothetical protein n=1 Tax=Hahella sp. NBU794 TaxID=3422590 RepID=UPI003D6E23B1
MSDERICAWWEQLSPKDKDEIDLLWSPEVSIDIVKEMLNTIKEVYFLEACPKLDGLNCEEFAIYDYGCVDIYGHTVAHEKFETEIIEWWTIGGGYRNSWIEVLYNGSNYKADVRSGRILCNELENVFD